ncbi:MAG: ATPase, T2SS/T4P/T4SS family [bacterium]
MLEIEIIKNNKKIFEITIQSGVVIGRSKDADIKLDDNLCSRRHLKIYRDGVNWFASDMNSSNGTFYNGHILSEAVALNTGDRLKIGAHEIYIKQIKAIDGSQKQVVDTTPQYVAPHEPIQPYALYNEIEFEKIDHLKQTIHTQLLEELDLKKLDLSALKTIEVRIKSEEVVKRIISRMRKEGRIDFQINEADLLKEVINEALGLGPLEPLLEDKSINEIMVNAKDQIYIERHGLLEKTALRFSSDTAVLNVIERIVSPIGRRIDESSPTVDARLKDGSRVHVIIPPLAIKGPTITIRKFSHIPYTIDDLIRFGSLTEHIAEFLSIAIKARKNIVVSGGTGSGKTTLLNVLSGFIPDDERIITIEDSAELKLNQPHVVSLEARPPNVEGKGAITIRELVRNALRMRPDRIIVGECRGGEALDMLQAMNTGHDGSLTTLHANSPRDALSRLETMVLMAGMELPVKAIREQIRSAIDLIVQQTRFKDGSRRVSAISEVQGMEGDTIVLQDIFLYEISGIERDGKIAGRFKPTGFVPRFVEELRAHHINISQELFT